MFALHHDPIAAVNDAQVVYTDTWTSNGPRKTKHKNGAGFFPPYQVNEALLKNANPSAVVLHCLPAHRGEEITDAVADGSQSLVFQQAENRLHAQKAVLARLLAE